MERRLEKRQEWAEGRDAKAAAAFNRARSLTADIPLGQPILVGHHSEKRHRRTLEKSDNAMRAGCESVNMADEHRAKADGIAAQLDRSIFSDDPNAPEALAARIAELEARRDAMKRGNAAFKKGASGGKPEGGALALRAEVGEKLALEGLRTMQVCPWVKQPFPGYATTNLGANIRRLKLRAASVEAQRIQTAKAEAAPGGVLVEITPPPACWSCRGSKEMDEGRPCYICKGSGVQGGEQARVTFPEYPGRATVQALKAAGFHWSAPSWHGDREKLPADIVRAVAKRDAAAEGRRDR
jgi:hypothetical protein